MNKDYDDDDLYDDDDDYFEDFSDDPESEEATEDWERSLNRLLDLAKYNGGSDLDKRKRTVSDKRLVWLLDPESLEITPLEQTLSKNAQRWTDGRATSLRRLHDGYYDKDWFSAADRTIISNSYGWKEVRPEKALSHLVGHPLVFRKSDRARITLEAGQVELVIQESEEGFHLSWEPYPCHQDYHFAQSGENRYTVYDVPTPCSVDLSVSRSLQSRVTVGKDGLWLPKAAAPKIMKLLRKQDEHFHIRTSIQAQECTPLSLPVVRLHPLGLGMEAELAIRPFDHPQSPAFPVAAGFDRPMMMVEGRTLKLQRNFEEEKNLATALVESCPILRDMGGLGPWMLDHMQTALECLLELQQSPLNPVLEWPQGASIVLHRPAREQNLHVRFSEEKNEWFSLEGSLFTSGSKAFELYELLELMPKGQGQFIPLDDGSFLALTRELKRTLERLRRLALKDKRGLHVHGLSAGVLAELLPDQQDAQRSAAWQQWVQRIHSAAACNPPLPQGLNAELRGYQEEGYVWLARLARWGAGACLADDMGLGKTVQAIALLLDQSQAGPALVIAPTSVCHNWESEIARFAPQLKTYRLNQSPGGSLPEDAKKGKASRLALIKSLAPGDVLITSYGLMVNEAAALATCPFSVAVFDEAQALKNAHTQRARASKSLQAGCRVALTGTPVENHLDDLWSIFDLVNPGLLGTLSSFRDRFDPADPDSRQALKALLRPFLLRRTKNAVLSELPPRTEQTLKVDLSDEELSFYQALTRHAQERIEKIPTLPKDVDNPKKRMAILTELTKLRLACCHSELVNPAFSFASSKLAVFMELLEEIRSGGHKALVFSQFVKYLAKAAEVLKTAGIDFHYLDGSTPEPQRKTLVQAFQRGEKDVFLISLKAGGQGLNLTAADYVIHLDPWWNPAVEDQASDRAHRIGQVRPVTIYRLVAKDTVEERMLALHGRKRELAADILAGASAAMSVQDMLALITGQVE